MCSLKYMYVKKTTNLMICANCLKCSPSEHIWKFQKKVPSSLSKMRFNIDYSCHTTNIYNFQVEREPVYYTLYCIQQN